MNVTKSLFIDKQSCKPSLSVVILYCVKIGCILIWSNRLNTLLVFQMQIVFTQFTVLLVLLTNSFSLNVGFVIFHLVWENYFPSNYGGTTQKLSIIWTYESVSKRLSTCPCYLKISVLYKAKLNWLRLVANSNENLSSQSYTVLFNNNWNSPYLYVRLYHWLNCLWQLNWLSCLIWQNIYNIIIYVDMGLDWESWSKNDQL